MKIFYIMMRTPTGDFMIAPVKAQPIGDDCFYFCAAKNGD